jgi:sarcosine oxidase
MWFRSAVGDRCITVFPQIGKDDAVSFFVEGMATEAEIADATKSFFERQIRPFFGDISSRLVASDLCYYTTTPDSGFIIDRHPDYDQLLVLAACSGHGFKHSLAVGEVAAQMLVEEVGSQNVSPFSLRRFDA